MIGGTDNADSYDDSKLSRYLKLAPDINLNPAIPPNIQKAIANFVKTTRPLAPKIDMNPAIPPNIQKAIADFSPNTYPTPVPSHIQNKLPIIKQGLTDTNIQMPSDIANLPAGVRDVASGFNEIGGEVLGTPKGAYNAIAHPYNTLLKPQYDLAHEAAKESGPMRYIHAQEAGLPVVGPALDVATRQAQAGNYGGALGTPLGAAGLAYAIPGLKDLNEMNARSLSNFVADHPPKEIPDLEPKAKPEINGIHEDNPYGLSELEKKLFDVDEKGLHLKDNPDMTLHELMSMKDLNEKFRVNDEGNILPKGVKVIDPNSPVSGVTKGPIDPRFAPIQMEPLNTPQPIRPDIKNILKEIQKKDNVVDITKGKEPPEKK